MVETWEMSGGPSRAVVLGAGWVGAAVARQLAGRVPTTVLDPGADEQLAGRSAAGAAALLEALAGDGPAAVVNCCGLLRGTHEELVAANTTWPEWLVEVLGGRAVRLVHVGSASEYGDPGGPGPIPETAEPRPSGGYGETKWAGSSAVLRARSQGMDAVVARGFNLVARDVPAASPLHQFRTDVESLPPGGGEVELWWPATVRDFVLLEDLGEALARLAVAPTVPEVVNVCSGVGLRFDGIVQALARRRGVEVRVGSADRPGIPAVVGDPTLLGRCTGLVPRMSAELIAETLLP